MVVMPFHSLPLGVSASPHWFPLREQRFGLRLAPWGPFPQRLSYLSTAGQWLRLGQGLKQGPLHILELSVEAEQEKSASYLHTLRKGVSQAWRAQSYGRKGVLSALALNPWPHSLIVAACASRAASLFHPQPASSGEGTAERELNLLLKVWQDSLWKHGCRFPCLRTSPLR